MAKIEGRSAVFLDRDGTLIHERHYLRDPALLELFPDVGEALRRLSQKGYLLFVVSNQSGVGRKIISADEFQAVDARLREVLRAEGVAIADYAYCFHHPDEQCHCRKPATGLIPKQWQGQALDRRSSFVVGDKLCDLQLADGIGAQGILVMTGYGEETCRQIEKASTKPPYWFCASLLEAAKRIGP